MCDSWMVSFCKVFGQRWVFIFNWYLRFGNKNFWLFKGAVIRATKLLQLATKSDFYACRATKFRWLKTWTLLAPLVHSFRIVPDHFQKKFFWNKFISATSPPPPPPPPPPVAKKFQDQPWDLEVSAKTWRLTGKPWDLAALRMLIENVYP
jgi:hypothetical protein